MCCSCEHPFHYQTGEYQSNQFRFYYFQHLFDNELKIQIKLFSIQSEQNFNVILK
jgi:hypothetical protein